MLADVALDLGPFGAYDVYPKRLPDLFKGTQLVVMGRYRSPEGTVVLSGSVNGQKKVFEYRAEAPKESKESPFVPRLWAIRKVGYLLDEIRLHGETPELKDAVVALGKKFGIVTPYTSYLVVEDTPMPVAVNRPPPPPRPWRVEEKRADDRDRFAPAPTRRPRPTRRRAARTSRAASSGGSSAAAPLTAARRGPRRRRPPRPRPPSPRRRCSCPRARRASWWRRRWPE